MQSTFVEFAALLPSCHHQLAALLRHNPSVSVGVVNLQYEGNVLSTQVSLQILSHFFSYNFFIKSLLFGGSCDNVKYSLCGSWKHFIEYIHRVLLN